MNVRPWIWGVSTECISWKRSKTATRHFGFWSGTPWDCRCVTVLHACVSVCKYMHVWKCVHACRLCTCVFAWSATTTTTTKTTVCDGWYRFVKKRRRNLCAIRSTFWWWLCMCLHLFERVFVFCVVSVSRSVVSASRARASTEFTISDEETIQQMFKWTHRPLSPKCHEMTS